MEDYFHVDGKIRKIIFIETFLISSKRNFEKSFSFSKKDLQFVHNKYLEEYFHMDKNIGKIILKIFLILYALLSLSDFSIYLNYQKD